MRVSRLLFVCLLLGGFVYSLPAEAQGVYRYVEKDGTIIYTNVAPKGVRAKKLKGTFKRASRPTDAPVVVQRLSTAEYDNHIEYAAARYQIPEALLWAVMHAESNFNTKAISEKGASGLMQLMPATAQEMYVKDIFDVRENISGGARYLRVLANMYDGDMVKMVAAYNAGPEAVRRHGGKVPPYPETQAYVRKVVGLYFHYKERLAKVSSRK